MLSVIASSMITVASLIFSITMLSLQLASSQFGPRTLGNFMRDRSNQIVLGTFIATFLYCLFVLRSVRGNEGFSFVPHLAVPVTNAASNVQQLMTLGVGPRDIINGLKIKLVEVAQLQKMEERRVEITALKAVNASNEIQLRKLMAEETSIDDAISRMSIGPMVKAGGCRFHQTG
jgi:hypothetical protein